MKKPAIHGFRIFRQEELPQTFIRVSIEQLDQCLQWEVKFAEHPDFSTHEIRKSTKRIRAVNKLFRRAIGEERYSRGNELHSRLSSILAAHRVSAVYIETLQCLASDKRLSLDSNTISRLAAGMTDRHLRFTNELMIENGLHRVANKILLAEREQLLTEPIPAIDFKVLALGLRNTYKQGCKSLIAISGVKSTENMHSLRKQVKLLWNQLVFLRPVWPVMLNSYIRQYDQLAEKLGMDHDLAELGQYFMKEPVEATSNEIASLLHAIEKKRSQVQKYIFPLAARLYAEKPVAFSKKIERYYREFVGQKK